MTRTACGDDRRRRVGNCRDFDRRNGRRCSSRPLGHCFRSAAEFLTRWDIEVVPFDTLLVEGAVTAYRRFGKGRHAARLNMGDCAAYALAKARGWPLLFKGEDFSQTDVERA